MANHEASLMEYYSKRREQYLDMPVVEVLDRLVANYVKENKDVLRPVSNTVVIMKSIDDALSGLNFDWEETLKTEHGLVVCNNDDKSEASLADFYAKNLSVLKDKSIEEVLMLWEIFIDELLRNTGSLINKDYKRTINVFYIKDDDSKDWVSGNRNDFENKTIGDKQSGVTMNFIYRKGDVDFNPDNLEERLREAKIKSLYRR